MLSRQKLFYFTPICFTEGVERVIKGIWGSIGIIEMVIVLTFIDMSQNWRQEGNILL